VTKEFRIGFSFERFVSIILGQVLRTVHKPSATILVYHDVTSGKRKSQIQNDSVILENFERQMKYLRENSFSPMPLQKLIWLIKSKKKIPKKSIIITFDDGYKSTYTNAYPVLQKYNIPATVFVAAGFIGQKKPFPWLEAENNNSGLHESMPMNEEEIIELYEGGIEIGSHTMYHNFLPKMNSQKIEEDILNSQYKLRNILGRTPLSLALPYSFPIKHRKWPAFKHVLTKTLVRGNFNACCTMNRGHITSNSNPLFLRRISVGKFDDLLLYHAKLLGGFAWSCIPQKIFQVFLKKYNFSSFPP